MSLSTPIGVGRACWLLVRLRLLRLGNQVRSGVLRFRRRSPSGQRGATAGKSKLGWFLASLVGLSMLFSFTNLAYQAVAHMQETFGWSAAVKTAERQVVQGWLGAQIDNLSRAQAEALGWAQPRGVKVRSSAPGSPAARAGLLPGDVLISIDERDVLNATGFAQMIAAGAPGSTVELRLLREGKEQRVRATLSERPVAPAHKQMRTRIAAAPGYVLAPGVLQACGLEMLILVGATLLLSLASRELVVADWDLEWLVTLPVSITTLLGVRIIERTLVNATGLIALWPFLSVVAWECGYRIAAPLLGLAATVPLLLITTTIWTVVDTTLRLRVNPPRLRNLQAIVSLAASLCFYLAMSAGLSSKSFLLDWAPGFPAWGSWLPPGLVVGALASSSGDAAAMRLLVLIVEVGALVGVGFWIVSRQLRFGVVGTSGRESGGRGIAAKIARASREGSARRLLSPIQARELVLLGRDRNFLVQTLILPVVIMGGQIFFNAPGSVFAFALGVPQHVAAAAFGVGAYALMFSAFQTLNAEGHALWILYSVPHSLESILREKALLWGSLCLGYAAIILGVGLAFNPGPLWQQLQLILLVIVGVPVFATIGAALGVFACDPLAQRVQRRVRPSYLYLYMLLATLYGYAVYANNFWQRFALVVLTALLGMALWQKARDHLPYLLDPAASPAARVSLADGLIAALLFFVLQGLVALILSLVEGKLSGRAVLIAFSVAGAATYGAMRFAYWSLQTEGVPRSFGPHLGQAAGLGAIAGILAAGAAFVYLKLAAHTPLFEGVREMAFTGREGALWLALLAIAAAPVFEEFIFRGLVFGGLRRLLGLPASVLASAAIFALVHPPASVIPVFGLGVAAALVYERTRILLAPVVVHAVYNAAIIAYQLLI